MEAELQTQVAFHLTGKKPAAEPAARRRTGRTSRPCSPATATSPRCATISRWCWLRDANDKGYVQSLSGIVDNVAHAIAKDDDGDRLTRHVLRLEQEIRVLLSGGAKGQLSALMGRWPPAGWRSAATMC